jgi:AbrB family looped-hinge helix DNA binding protein
MDTVELTMAERGQIVIPKKARDALGLRPGVTMELRVQGQTLVIQKCVKLNLSPWIGYAKDDGLSAQQDLAALRGRPVPWTGSAADKALLALPQAVAAKKLVAAAVRSTPRAAAKRPARTNNGATQ